jgi:hypothetical protein
VAVGAGVAVGVGVADGSGVAVGVGEGAAVAAGTVVGAGVSMGAVVAASVGAGVMMTWVGEGVVRAAETRSAEETWREQRDRSVASSRIRIIRTAKININRLFFIRKHLQRYFLHYTWFWREAQADQPPKMSWK